MTTSKNNDIANLFQTISNVFIDELEPALTKIKDALADSHGLKNEDKKLLLNKVRQMFNAANDITKKLGNIGKVK